MASSDPSANWHLVGYQLGPGRMVGSYRQVKASKEVLTVKNVGPFIYAARTPVEKMMQ